MDGVNIRLQNWRDIVREWVKQTTCVYNKESDNQAAYYFYLYPKQHQAKAGNSTPAKFYKLSTQESVP